MESRKITAAEDRGSDKSARIGAAPSLGYTLTLSLLFGASLIVASWFYSPALRIAKCEVADAPYVTVITVSRVGNEVIAECMQVSGRGAYTKAGRK